MRSRRWRHHRPRETAWLPPEDDDGYRGPGLLTIGDRRLQVDVHLAGHLEPLDGRFHWYGRVQRDDAVVAAKEAGASHAMVTLGDGPAREARLAEVDPWGNIALRGEGPPPYPLEPVEVELPLPG